MYYAHFGLKEPPFKITPNTEFFFSGGNRGAILDALIYAITTGEGIIKVVGEVGSGKTMLCRMLQTLLPQNVESVYLVNPSVAPEDVLNAIAFELQLKLAKSADRLQVLQALQKYLVERHSSGQRVVIFVEEAQGMALETLEQIRLLTNLETKHDKLLQIVLFGQPELDDNLNQTQIRQLRERVTHSFNLGPLDEKEIGEYLIFRLRAAGYFGPHLFSKSAVKLLTKAAKGLVRRVNILADKSLLAAFSENVYLVTNKHVAAAIKDSEFALEYAKERNRQYLYYSAAAAVLAGLIVLPLMYLAPWSASQPEQQLLAKKPAIKDVVVAQTAPPVTPAVAPDPVPPAQVETPAATPAVPLQTTPAIAVQPATPAQTVAIATPEKSTTAVVTSKQTEPAQPQPVTVSAAPTASANVQTSVTAPAEEKEDVLKQRLDAAKDWLQQSATSTVTMQLMGGADDEQMRDQIKSLAKDVDLDKIYVFRTRENGRPYMILTYGSYQSWNAAAQAMQKLPRQLRQNRPKLRTVGGIQKETKLF